MSHIQSMYVPCFNHTFQLLVFWTDKVLR